MKAYEMDYIKFEKDDIKGLLDAINKLFEDNVKEDEIKIIEGVDFYFLVSKKLSSYHFREYDNLINDYGEEIDWKLLKATQDYNL